MCGELDQSAHSEPGSLNRGVVMGRGLVVRRAGDVEMGPVDAWGHETLQKSCSEHRAAFASAGGLDVAMSECRPSRTSSVIGSSQKSSPAASEASSKVSAAWAPEVMTPAVWLPRATMQAPVRVEMSTMKSGLSSHARARPSAITMRPSASELPFSTVVPSYIVTTSEGRHPDPDGIFSAKHP